jgi:prohibitin 2
MSNPQDMFKKLQRMANDAGRRGGAGPPPKGMATAVGGGIALVALLMVGNNALFNVDGGHRAIKYTRIGGVGKQIYGEGRGIIFLGAYIHGWRLTYHFFQEHTLRSHGSRHP